jgi:ribosomal protein S18 acetylase RimI-like enzyme
VLSGFTLRAAGPSDAETLTRFGERTFRDTFGPHNRAEDMDAYCAAAFTVDQRLAELIDPDQHVLLVERAGELAAYAHLRPGHAPPCVTGPAPMQLLRFYVDRPWHGSGLASSLMNATVGAAAERAARTLHLTVWEHNTRAIAFYQRHGFREVGTMGFLLGSDAQTDRVMIRTTRAAH